MTLACAGAAVVMQTRFPRRSARGGAAPYAADGAAPREQRVDGRGASRLERADKVDRGGPIVSTTNWLVSTCGTN